MNVDSKDIGLLEVYTMESKYKYKGTPINKLTDDKKQIHLWLVRINKGWSVEQAVEVDKKPKKPFKHFVNGEPAALIAERHGISRVQFYSRLSRGFSPKDACCIPIRKTKKQIEWEKHKND